MAREAVKNGKTVYICEECGYIYEQKEWAEKCQQWCSSKQSYNLEFTQHGISPGHHRKLFRNPSRINSRSCPYIQR